MRKNAPMPTFDERDRSAVTDADSAKDFDDASDTLYVLERQLSGLPVNNLAELVGMSTIQMQRCRQEGGTSPHRLQLVARLVAILRHSWTDHGIYAWFHRERLELGGHSPIDLLDDTRRESDLLLLARSGRVQVGS